MTESLVSLLTPIVIAVVGAIWTYSQYRIQKSYNNAQIYWEFQQRFKEFQALLPAGINQKDGNGNYSYVPPEGERERYNRVIEQYWWLVFDEWFICCRECKSCRSLWKDYYSNGVIDALERADFREALKRLLAKGNSFLGQDRDFSVEIDQLYKKQNGGKSLFV